MSGLALDQFDAAILSAALFQTIVGDGTLLAEACGREPAGIDARGDDGRYYGLSSSLGQRLIVGGNSGVVRMPFDADFQGRLAFQPKDGSCSVGLMSESG